jgi:hypothetical protein
VHACARGIRKEHEKQLLSGQQCNTNVMQESANINENGKASIINTNKEKHKSHMQNAESCLLF